jgi:hypothetical protein
METTPKGTLDAVVASSSVLEEREMTVGRCKLLLTVRRFEIHCPVRAVIPPSLMITGDVPPLFFSAADEAASLATKGDVITFGGLEIRFSGDCRSVAVAGKKYDIGVPGAGTSLEFGDGELIGFTSSRP